MKLTEALIRELVEEVLIENQIKQFTDNLANWLVRGVSRLSPGQLLAAPGLLTTEEFWEINKGKPRSEWIMARHELSPDQEQMLKDDKLWVGPLNDVDFEWFKRVPAWNIGRGPNPLRKELEATAVERPRWRKVRIGRPKMA